MKIKKTLNILLVIVIILQNPIWLFWNPIFTWISYLIVFFTIIMFFSGKEIISTLNKYLILWILLLSIFIIRPIFFEFRTSSLFIVLTIFLCILIKHKYNTSDVILYTTKYLSIVIFISLPLWLLHKYMHPFPIYNVIDLTSMKGIEASGYSAYMLNYLFFVTDSGDNYRFYSMFDEPGVLGTLSAFVLYANKYNFRDKKNIIIFIGSIFTFSLAFYILTILGVLINTLLINGKDRILKFIVYILVGLFVFTLLIDNDTFNNSIIYRFNNIEDNIEGRNDESLNLYFSKFILSPDAAFGNGTNFLGNFNFGLNGASYKMFIIEYGFVGIFLLILLYISIMSKRNVANYILLFFFLISFIQRPLLFSSWQLILFAIISQNLTYNDKFLFR